MRHVHLGVSRLIFEHHPVSPTHPQEDMRVRRSWIGLIIAAGASLALAACGGGGSNTGSPTASDVGVTKDQITLGATVALSGSAGSYGTIAKASDAYFQYVNAKGGVHGRKIKYIYLDDGYNPAQTVPLTRELVEQDQVFATFGGLGTQTQTSVRQYLNSKRVPQVFVASGATTFSAGEDANGHKYPYTFGWQPVYQGEALIYAKYVLQHLPNAKIGIIYQNDDYGQDYLNGLKKGLGAAHQGMIVDVQNNDATASDLSSQIVHLKASGADTFFIFEIPKPAIISLVTANAIGWHPQIFLNSVSAPIPYVQAAEGLAKDPAAVNGLLSVGYFKDAVSPQLANDPGITLYKQVMSQYYPTGKVADAFNIYGMATAWSMVDALDKAGVNPTRASLVDAVNHLYESNNPFLLPGITVQNTPSSHYSITQELIAKYDVAVSDYTPVSGLLNVRGKVRFP
jgi:branched-chain amino acid transport system substrate-binding protein